MRDVPSIAGGHHEKMDGTGYPKRLQRDDMPLTARMMAIADIFEALTASDRPYKKAKTLSEAIRIMSFMRKDAHIDPALFELFLRSGVYLEYAHEFLAGRRVCVCLNTIVSAFCVFYLNGQLAAIHEMNRQESFICHVAFLVS